MSGDDETDADPESETASRKSAEADPGDVEADRTGRTESTSDDADATGPNGNDEHSTGDDSGGFLGNIKNARDQLGDAKEAFSNARGAGSLPTDEEGRVRLVCRRYEERRLVPLDDRGRPTCYEAGNADCESCVEAVRDGSVGTW